MTTVHIGWLDIDSVVAFQLLSMTILAFKQLSGTNASPRNCKVTTMIVIVIDFYREIPKDSRSSSHYFCRVQEVTITACLLVEFVRSPLASGAAWGREEVV